MTSCPGVEVGVLDIVWMGWNLVMGSCFRIGDFAEFRMEMDIYLWPVLGVFVYKWAFAFGAFVDAAVDGGGDDVVVRNTDDIEAILIFHDDSYLRP